MDAAGNVYALDEINVRIQKFDSDGNFQRAWGKNVAGGGAFGICTVAASCLAGSVGTLGGELSGPRGIAADPAGNVYVADTGNNRIQKFAEPPPPDTTAPNTRIVKGPKAPSAGGARALPSAPPSRDRASVAARTGARSSAAQARGSTAGSTAAGTCSRCGP